MANLDPSPSTRFRPGCSGNPNGRPAGPGLARIFRELLERIDPKTGRAYIELLCERILLEAMKGKIAFCRLLFDTIEGKVPRQVIYEHRYVPEIDAWLRRAFTVAYGDGWESIDFASKTDDELHAIIAREDEPAVAGRINLPPESSKAVG